MRYTLSYWLFKWYNVHIRTQLGIYGQIEPFSFRSSLGLCPLELLQAKGYIWPDIPRLVLIGIQSYLGRFSSTHIECLMSHHQLTKTCNQLWLANSTDKYACQWSSSHPPRSFTGTHICQLDLLGTVDYTVFVSWWCNVCYNHMSLLMGFSMLNNLWCWQDNHLHTIE